MINNRMRTIHTPHFLSSLQIVYSGMVILGVTLLKIIAGVVLLLRIGRVIGSSSDKSVVSLVITFVRFDHAGSESVRVSCCRLRFVHLDVVVCGVLFLTCSAGSD